MPALAPEASRKTLPSIECITNSVPRDADWEPNAIGRLRRHFDQRSGIEDGQCAQEDCVHEAVNGRVGTDPQCDRQYGGARKRRTPDHRSQRVARVLRDLFEKAPRPESAGVFSQQGHVAEITVGSPGGLIIRQPAGTTFVGLLLEMELQLLAKPSSFRRRCNHHVNFRRIEFTSLLTRIQE
jgi:hypothetical protein